MRADRRRWKTVEVAATVDVPPEQVWAVLADPWSYAHWVCGTVSIRRADPEWPGPGSRLFHRFGPWPFRVRDCTTVRVAEPPHRLVLDARARPLGRVEAELTVDRCPDGARIVLRQRLRGGLGAVFARAGHSVQVRRNARSLHNLVAYCEARSR
jgi:uncharacterized protein YndB with AHSA1/START domain